MARWNTYSEEQKTFLRENAGKYSRAELTAFFNWTFGTDKSELAIKSYCNNRGWGTGKDGRFEKGHKSWQVGLRGDEYKSHFTPESFQRGIAGMNEASKTVKIGDEIIRSGVPYVYVSLDYTKTRDERIVAKRRLIWEQKHGPIPEGHRIINLNRDQMDCSPENLACVPAQYIPILSRNGWWSTDPELTRAAIRWCELFYTIKELEE